MIKNRKNTTNVVSTWRDYLSGKQNNKRSKSLNESSTTAKDRNEYFEAIIADLSECEWEQDRIDVLVDALRNASDEQLSTIAYGSDSAMMDNAFDERYGNNDMDDDYDSQAYYDEFPTGSGE